VIEVRGGTILHFISPSIFRQASVCACLPYVNDRVTYGELEIFTDVRVETHYIAVLYSLLTLSDLVVKAHGLGPTPVQSVTSVQRRVSDYGMSLQILGSFELAFPLYFDSIANTL